MATGREDAFEQALTALRARLIRGEFAAGERVAASALASRLRLSATPVREALCHLAGEGLIDERRNQGFFVRVLTGVDAADLLRLRLTLLLILVARAPDRAGPAAAARAVPAEAAAETFLAAWIADADSRVLVEQGRALTVRLAPVLRLADRVLEDTAAETRDLLALAETGDAAAFAQALRRYHGRRIQAADKLIALLNTPAKI